MYLDTMAKHLSAKANSYLDRARIRTGKALESITRDNIRETMLMLDRINSDLRKTYEALEGLKQVRDVQQLIDRGV